MKISVRKDRQITIRAVVPVNVTDASSELEKIAVRMLQPVIKREQSQEHKSERERLKEREEVWGRIFRRLMAHAHLAESLQEPESVRPKREPKTKTVEFKITVPSIPEIHSFKDVKRLLARARTSIVRSSRRARISSGVAAVIVILCCYMLFFRSHPAPTAIDTSDRATLQGPILPKGSPTYPTILPAGKTIDQLGGWTRISPAGRNPVYAYVDSIDGARIDVSEQPLPPGFQVNTERQIAQLAQNFKASDKVPVGGTSIYIATFADDSQSVILSKNKLLILMKSNALLPPTKWAAYAKSLQ